MSTDHDDERPVIDAPKDTIRATIARRDAQFVTALRGLGAGPFGGLFALAALEAARKSPDPIAARSELLAALVGAVDRLLQVRNTPRGEWRRLADLRAAVAAEWRAATGELSGTVFP